MTKEKKPASLLPGLLGKNIRERRSQLGWTQATLAELVKVDVETISRIERGAIVPSVLKLEQVANVLGLPLAEVLRSSSTLAQDQSLEILGWLQSLSEADRQFVLAATQQLCRHLVKSA
ncbi:MAG: helix-turn-helix transcriptional regulator [Gallionellaceae bacterium]